MVERRDLPLFAWSDAQRAARARRGRLVRRTVLAGIGMVALGATIATPPPPLLVWNVSASAPLGLYASFQGITPERGDMVIAWPPESIRKLAATRHYLPLHVPLVKRVAAVAGDTVCGKNDRVSINGLVVAIRRKADAAGRPLPSWQGCRRLSDGAVFLLMAGRPDSFDGRYFGVSRQEDVLGRATRTWPD